MSRIHESAKFSNTERVTGLEISGEIFNGVGNWQFSWKWLAGFCRHMWCYVYCYLIQINVNNFTFVSEKNSFFLNLTLLGILDTSFHLANVILTDQFHVKSWISYKNVVILLHYLWVKEIIIVSILVWVKKNNNSRWGWCDNFHVVR